MYVNKRGLREIGNVLFKKPTVGRLVTTAWIAPIFMGLRQTAATFRALDEVMYPKYRDQKVERPVFVFANPRSGTTLTHRLISMDDEVFTTVKLYQTIFPAITATKTFKRLVGLAQTRVGSVLNRAYDFFNAPLESRPDRPLDMIPAGGILVLFLVPFLDKSPEKRPSKRPLAMILMFLSVASIITLTLIGILS